MTTRPLTGEPLALDLLNTIWPERGRLRDAFGEPDGVRNWLTERGFEDAPDAERPLREVRDVLLEVLEQPGAAAERKLNEVLAHGRLRPTLRDGRPDELIEVDQPEWRLAWLVAHNYLELLHERPERIRRCAHPACTLYFRDMSKGGKRRWCTYVDRLRKPRESIPPLLTAPAPPSAVTGWVRRGQAASVWLMGRPPQRMPSRCGRARSVGRRARQGGSR